ncbi:medium-chain fatty acid-CoA ligase faa2, partial [Coemansia furcata]
ASKGELRHPLWDRVLFRKVAAQLGGRIKVIISGCLNLKPEVIDFFHAVLSCKLMIRSPSLFAGYFEESEKTQATMDGEWLATGDIVQINATGTVSFVGRTKNHAKINTGYCVSSERLEGAYAQHPMVQALFVDGQQDYDKVVVIVVPESTEFIPWTCSIANAPGAPLEELCARSEVAKELTEVLRIYSASVGLSVDEQLGAIYIESVPFNEKKKHLYTYLPKFKRQAAAKHYEEQLKKLYAEVGGFFIN